jgi:hypothetical protein
MHAALDNKEKSNIIWSFEQIYLSLLQQDKLNAMSTPAKNIIEYVTVVISAFGKQFSLSNAAAYRYMKRYSGLDYLIKDYEGIHTLSIEDAIDFVSTICKRHGGALS